MSTELVIVTPRHDGGRGGHRDGHPQGGLRAGDRGHRLLGIFTERDVLRAVGSDFDAEHHAVSEFMTADPHTARPTEDAHDALGSMLAFGFRHLPVMEGGRGRRRSSRCAT